MAPMHGFFGFFQVSAVVSLSMKTHNSCNEEIFKGNLLIVIVGISIVWLYPILREQDPPMVTRYIINKPRQTASIEALDE
jgi:hypothetical protein